MNYPSEIPSGSFVDRRYEIVKTLGQGGFGRTYLVKDKRRFEKYCVLKEFVPQATDKYAIAKSRELFEREAKVLNQLEHRQIPKFSGWFEEEKRLFLVQQYVDGKTYADLLYERQQQNRTFTEQEVTGVLKDILPVLKYIHNNNIIHRDISPDNIMLCNKVDKPILIDFGIANQRTATQVASGAVSGGSIVGKLSYSPLEQIGRGVCFHSSDLYALAVTAMVLLTGKQPKDFYDINEERWQWRRYTNVSDSLASVIDKMSLENHKDRYQSAQEVLDALGGNSQPVILDPGKTHITRKIDPTYIPPKPDSNRTPAIIGASALALIGSLFFLTPNVSGICDALNNCSEDIELEARYEKIADRSEPKIAIAADDNNLNTYELFQLVDLKSDLEKLVEELQAIPADAKVSDRVQKTLADINTQIKRVEAAATVDTNVGVDMGDGIFTKQDAN